MSNAQATSNVVITVIAVVAAGAALYFALGGQCPCKPRDRTERAQDKADRAKRNASRAVDDAADAVSEGVNAVREKVANAVNPNKM